MNEWVVRVGKAILVSGTELINAWFVAMGFTKFEAHAL